MALHIQIIIKTQQPPKQTPKSFRSTLFQTLNKFLKKKYIYHIEAIWTFKQLS